MKKTYIIIALIILSITSFGVFTVFNGSKVPFVSEHPSIPEFIDNVMNSERAIVDSISRDTSSVNGRLVKLGFTTKAASMFDYHTAKALSELYRSYDSIYPAYKFVNFKCVAAIIKTHGLSMGSADLFICDIPESRIAAMEKFRPSYMLSRDPFHDLFLGMERISSINAGYGNLGDYIRDAYDKITAGKGSLGKETDMARYAIMDMKERPQSGTMFLLLAPASCFSGRPNEAGNFSSMKDPIVLAPVQGGYIIVTAW